MSKAYKPYRIAKRQGTGWIVLSEHNDSATVKSAFLEHYPLAEIRVERLTSISINGPNYEAIPDYELSIMFAISMQLLYEARQRHQEK